ncbi:hypothetical protein KAZ93_02250 [Patescibacteria group bacterium]|nr:hypothetical protein [Patescibacteria group bacterium]
MIFDSDLVIIEIDISIDRESCFEITKEMNIQTRLHHLDRIRARRETLIRHCLRFDDIGDCRRRKERLHIILSPEPLFDDIHMKHPEKSATKTHPESFGHLMFKRDRTIIQDQLLKSLFELVVLDGLQWIDSCIDEWLRLGKSLYSEWQE